MLIALNIPIRSDIETVFSLVQAGTVRGDTLLGDEKLALVPYCINEGWSVMEMATRLGWSTMQVRTKIRDYFKEREMQVYEECGRERVAVEAKVFGEMLRNACIKTGKEKDAWFIHKSMIETLQSIGIVPKVAKQLDMTKTETRIVYKVTVDETGITRTDKIIDTEAREVIVVQPATEQTVEITGASLDYSGFSPDEADGVPDIQVLQEDVLDTVEDADTIEDVALAEDA